jgi:hypothetical protein
VAGALGGAVVADVQDELGLSTPTAPRLLLRPGGSERVASARRDASTSSKAGVCRRRSRCLHPRETSSVKSYAGYPLVAVRGIDAEGRAVPVTREVRRFNHASGSSQEPGSPTASEASSAAKENMKDWPTWIFRMSFSTL